MTCTKLTDEAYAKRLVDMDDDELHAEGFELVRKRSRSRWSFTARMVALNAELARRDGRAAAPNVIHRAVPGNGACEQGRCELSTDIGVIHSPFYDKPI